MCLYPGTPPPSVYQVTHGTALQAVERYVRQLSCEDGRLIGLRYPSVASAGGAFCTAKGSYFVLLLSVCLWADQTDGEGQTGKLAYMAEHAHQAARA